MAKDDEPRQQRLRFWKAHGKAVFQLNQLAMGCVLQSTFLGSTLSRGNTSVVDRTAVGKPPEDVVVLGPPGTASGPFRSWARHWMLQGMDKGADAGRKKRKVGRRGTSAAKQPDPGKAKFAVPGEVVEDCDELLEAMATAIETMHSSHAKRAIIANNTVLFAISYSEWLRYRSCFAYDIGYPIAITPGSEDLSRLPLLLASGDSVPDIKTLWQFFTPLDVLIALPTARGCSLLFLSTGALEAAGQELEIEEYGASFDDLPAPPPRLPPLPPPPPVPPHSSRLWMGQLGVEPGELEMELEDEDKTFLRRLSEAVLAKHDITELATHTPVLDRFPPRSSIQQPCDRHPSPTLPPPQDIPKLTIRLDKLLGKGRLATAFTATVTHITHALSPHPLREGQQLVAKAVHLGALGFMPRRKYEYTYHEAWDAVGREAQLLSGPLDKVDRMRVAPRLYGVWRGGKDSEGDSWVVLLLDIVEKRLISVRWFRRHHRASCCTDRSAMISFSRAEIMGVYGRMHEAGVVQGDVRERHILRHEDGWLRIIDYEGGQQRPEEVGTEAAKAWETERLLENRDVFELVTRGKL
ncbi:hypothetical protein IAT38_004664 [Cryptococcus sp. DSM 104549]